MLAAVLLAFREGLEAALIVGIVLGALNKMGARQRQRSVWLGVGLAAWLSFGVAVGLTFIGIELDGIAEQIFEGATMLIAAGVLTWMIFWMQYQGRRMKGELEAEVRQALVGGAGWGLFGLSFIAVFREGVETALLLTANAFNSSATDTLIGTLIGLALAVGAGWLLFATTVRLNTRQFFRVTSVVLIVFAAGLVAHGIHEFNEAGLIPEVVEHIWNTNGIVPQESQLGSVLTTLFGYNAMPSLTELLGYVTYFVVVWLGARRLDQFMARRAVQAAS
ncbi:MAG: FTR1 family protein [Chloroflexota bacterium]